MHKVCAGPMCVVYSLAKVLECVFRGSYAGGNHEFAILSGYVLEGSCLFFSHSRIDYLAFLKVFFN